MSLFTTACIHFFSSTQKQNNNHNSLKGMQYCTRGSILIPGRLQASIDFRISAEQPQTLKPIKPVKQWGMCSANNQLMLFKS